MDCGREFPPDYMVRDEIWEEADGEGILCMRCLESRLGRELTLGDLKRGVPVNRPYFKGSEME